MASTVADLGSPSSMANSPTIAPWPRTARNPLLAGVRDDADFENPGIEPIAAIAGVTFGEQHLSLLQRYLLRVAQKAHGKSSEAIPTKYCAIGKSRGGDEGLGDICLNTRSRFEHSRHRPLHGVRSLLHLGDHADNMSPCNLRACTWHFNDGAQASDSTGEMRCQSTLDGDLHHTRRFLIGLGALRWTGESRLPAGTSDS